MSEDPGREARQQRLIAEYGESRPVDTAAALRLLGVRDQVHPLDAGAYAYRDRAAADAWQTSTFEHHGVPSLGTAIGGDEVIGVYDYRADVLLLTGRLTDPALPDDWQPWRKQEAS